MLLNDIGPLQQVSLDVQKTSLKECGFVNLALKIQCLIVKNTLPQTANFYIPVGKIAEKAACRGVFLNNMALYFEFQINKNALLQTVFLAILRFCSLGISFSLSLTRLFRKTLR